MLNHVHNANIDPYRRLPVAPEGHPREWSRWLLEINSAEFEAIHDHVDDGDIVDMKPVN
jgi:hypothetical protein